MVKWVSLAAILALPLLCGGACGRQAPAARHGDEVRLERIWRLGGLSSPESVALSADGAFLYVTNVNGEGEVRDGNGFISRISIEGRMLERAFAQGLDAPKGAALSGDTLYVADIDTLVVLDAASGAVRRRLRAPGAQFLNDVAILPGGMVLAADSATRRIYAIEPTAGAGATPETMQVWLEDPLLDSINGLLAERDRLLVTTMAGRLLAIDYRSRAIAVLAEGLGEADGVAALGEGRYLVSAWPGLIQVAAPDGSHVVIADTRAEPRYMNDFVLVGDVLYQPHWTPGELTAYRVVQSAP